MVEDPLFRPLSTRRCLGAGVLNGADGGLVKFVQVRVRSKQVNHRLVRKNMWTLVAMATGRVLLVGTQRTELQGCAPPASSDPHL